MISSLEDIIPISDLIHGANKIIKRLKKNKRPIFITQNGKVSIVCMDVQDFEERSKRIAMENLKSHRSKARR